ncbi:MAG: hypothetical protein BGO96_09895 [Micrococcales bacterium 73-15]|nr:MAG: hypothetical protein BGO96_09895 [Micrococcales bacterium 73-15]
MHGALTEVLSRGGNALDKMLSAYAALADLVASDVVVQGGIYLQNQPGTELADATNEPYLEWVRLARILVLEGVEDGSVRPDVDADGAAEFLNALFIGAQVLSNHADSWASMPVRMRSFEPLVRIALAPASS